MTKHGGPRPAIRPDDGRRNNRNRSGKGGPKGWTVTAKLGENEFTFPTGRQRSAVDIKAFAEMLGYTVTIEKQSAN